jgi:hypothetical protein
MKAQQPQIIAMPFAEPVIGVIEQELMPDMHERNLQQIKEAGKPGQHLVKAYHYVGTVQGNMPVDKTDAVPVLA